MKGYITNGVCYIFPQEAAQIPEVEADVFYVQQEDYAAWLAANESLADKLVKYNYNLLAVRPKPFAGHTDDDLEPAYTITLAGPYAEHFTLSASSAYEGTRIAVVPESEDYYPENVTVTTSPSTNIDWQERDPEWHFTMPAADVTVTTATAQPTTYTFDIYITGTAGAIYSQSYAEGDEVNYTFGQVFENDDISYWDWTMIPSELDYTFDQGTPATVDETDPDNPVDIPEVPASISFIMPAEAVEFTLTQVYPEQPEPDPENPE